MDTLSTEELQDLFQDAAAKIRDADAIWIGAGAGMGVDSGLPDFRGNEGFWNAYPPYRKLGLSFYDLANPSWFRDDPQRAWGFYGHRRNLYRSTEPHFGFTVLRDSLHRLEKDHFVFTSNVDGHFQKSGFEPHKIVECHGSINHSQCAVNCCQQIWESEPDNVSIDEQSMRAREPLPACLQCSRVARPNILMFGDGEWLPDRTDQQYLRYATWLKQHASARIVGVEFGAGTAVPTVRWEAEARTDLLIRVNPREAHAGGNSISIPCGAQTAINGIAEWL